MRLIVATVPSRECSPNVHVHHMIKHRAQQQLKTDVGWLLKGQMDDETITDPVDVAIHIIWPKGHKRMDTDNAIASCKFVLDSLTEARVWVDDDLVHDITVDQQTWSQANRPAIYEATGCMTIDIEPIVEDN